MKDELTIQDIATLLYFVDEELKKRELEIAKLENDESFKYKALVRSLNKGVNLFRNLKNKLSLMRDRQSEFDSLEETKKRVLADLQDKYNYYTDLMNKVYGDDVTQFGFYYDGVRTGYKEAIAYLKEVDKNVTRS